ncbi:hypothetical protein [Actinomadura verrucosospora]|uniref:Uncharacterized protein n=1 Tax=Actinomadura verrucosospora TaxID=46165 RepID=A0A7D3W2B6_ACTVE|nr:hypothetical protein [Actinomadura verrucosospora]QKG26874.1 hypothetical protein ACTIVE_8527 [Actinomadura verrucosospora]
MPDEVLQHVIDGLLPTFGELAGWTGPPSAGAYERVEAARLRLGEAMTEQPARTAEYADEIFEAVLLDSGTTSQLLHPLIAAIGRRPVLLRLTRAVEEGPCRRSANAGSAAYWVRCWPPRPKTVPAEVRTAEDLIAYLHERAATLTAQPENRVDDLWPPFWRACMAAFVACDDDDVRRVLETTFPLASECRPPEVAELVAAVRAIVDASPEKYQRLRDGTTGLGHAI